MYNKTVYIISDSAETVNDPMFKANTALTGDQK